MSGVVSGMVVVVALLTGVAVRRRRRPVGRRASVDPRRELAGAALHLARATQVGQSVTSALPAVAARADGPVGEQLRRVASAVSRGASLSEALQRWTASVSAPSRPGRTGGRTTDGARRGRWPTADDVALFAAATSFGHLHGGDLPRAYEGVAVALLERAELAEEAAALTSQARASAAVLCGLPVLGVAVFAVVDPSLLGVLLGAPLGWSCLATATALDAAAALVASAMVRRAGGRR